MGLKSATNFQIPKKPPLCQSRTSPPSILVAKIATANKLEKRQIQQLWWLAIVGFFAVYLVKASLYSVRGVGKEDEKVAVLVEHDKKLQYAGGDTHVRSSSGSVPASKDSVINLDQ